MKLETKLILPFIIFLASILFISVSFFHFSKITQENYQRIENSDSRFNTEASSINYYNVMRELSFVSYVKFGEEKDLESYNKYKQKADDLYAQVVEGIENQELKESYNNQTALLAKLIQTEDQSIKTRTFDPNYDEMRKEFHASMDFVKEYYRIHVDEEFEHNIEQASTYRLIISLLIILSVLLTVMEFIMIKKDVLTPMQNINHINYNLKEMKTESGSRTDKEEIERLQNMVKLAMVLLKDKEKK